MRPKPQWMRWLTNCSPRSSRWRSTYALSCRLSRSMATLERIGDQATNIASRAIDASARSNDSVEACRPADIQSMGDKVGVMIRRAIQALLEGDSKLGRIGARDGQRD